MLIVGIESIGLLCNAMLVMLECLGVDEVRVGVFSCWLADC